MLFEAELFSDFKEINHLRFDRFNQYSSHKYFVF